MKRFEHSSVFLHGDTVIMWWFIRSNYDVNSAPAGFAPGPSCSRFKINLSSPHTRYRSMLDEKWQAGHKRSQVPPASRGIIAVCLTLHPVMGGTRTPKGFGLVITLISSQVIKHIGRVRVFLNTFWFHVSVSVDVVLLSEWSWRIVGGSGLFSGKVEQRNTRAER